MKLINTRTYFLAEVLEEGQCTLCGEKLEWDSAPFEEKLLASSMCCNFMYMLTYVEKVVDEEPSTVVAVLPVKVLGG